MSDSSARPVGRPSTRDARRSQLVEAAVRCMLRDGVAGLSRRTVAAEAGMSPASVHYFVGTMDELIGLAVEEVLHRVEAATHGFDQPTADLGRRVDALFDGSIQPPEINQLVDELVAYSYRHRPARLALGELYQQFRQVLTHAIAAAHPNAGRTDVEIVADGIVALAHAGATFDHLDLADVRTNLREAAERLVAGLSDCPDSTAPG